MISFLSAPYTGSKEEIENRIKLLCLVDSVLMKNGEFTVSPLYKHFMLKFSDLPGSWEYWKSYSKELLLKCDKMIVLTIPGWETSTGVSGEIKYARENNIPV